MERYFRWFGLPGAFVLTVLMSAFALVLAIVFPSADRWLCFAAMVCSSLGDIFLMNFRGIRRKLSFPYSGECAFALSHLLYIAAYRTLIRTDGHRLLNPGFLTAVLLIGTAGFVLMAFAIKKRRAERAMILVCMLYMLVIGAACATVWSYAWSAGGWRVLGAVGSLSFVVSDYFIGMSRLTGYRGCDDLIWWFYPVGQILLLIAG